jgi:hypothetical protein
MPLQESRLGVDAGQTGTLVQTEKTVDAAKRVLSRQTDVQLRELQSLETRALPAYKPTTRSLPHRNLTRDVRRDGNVPRIALAVVAARPGPITACVGLRNHCVCDRDWSCPVGTVETNLPVRAATLLR